MSELTLDGPIFVPRALNNDNSYLSYRRYPIVNFAANFFHLGARYDNVKRLAREQADLLMVDPRTTMFQFGGHAGKPTYSSLSYATEDGQILSLRDFQDSSFRPRYTEQVLVEELRWEADILVPPYFLCSGPEDPWFAVSCDCARLAASSYPNMPIMVFVAVRSSVLLNPSGIQHLARELAGLNVAGYYILVAGLNEQSITTSQVTGYIDLVQTLESTGRKVIPAQVGRIGLILVAFGASGYSAGFEKLDRFEEADLQARGAGGGRTTRYYLRPMQLHTYSRIADAIIDKTDVLADQYPCECNHCQGRLPLAMRSMERTLHFIDNRHSELEAIGAAEDRIDTVSAWFQDAANLCIQSQEQLSRRPFEASEFTDTHYRHIFALRDALSTY